MFRPSEAPDSAQSPFLLGPRLSTSCCTCTFQRFKLRATTLSPHTGPVSPSMLFMPLPRGSPLLTA